MTRSFKTWALALALSASLTACGSDSSSSSSGSAAKASEPGGVVVSAASSLKGALTAYGANFKPGPVRLSFAGSDELAAQIEQGVKPDVFASANTKLPQQLYEKGLVEKPKVFAGNRLVLAVPAGSKIKTIADPGKTGTTVAIGSASVPVGAYTHEVLAKLGADGKAILANVRSEEPDVKGVVGKLTQGAVDAGFVYITDVDATTWPDRAIELPARCSPSVAYGIAVVKGAKHPSERKGVRRRRHGRAAGTGAQGRRLRAAAGLVSASAAFRVAVTLALAVALVFLTVPVLAIFIDTSPSQLLSSLGDPAARDALRLSLVTTVARAGHHRRGRHACCLCAGERRLPRQVLRDHADRAAARAPAGRRGHRPARRARTPRHPRLRAPRPQDQLVLQTAGVVVALVFVSAPFYLRQAQAAFAAVDPS